MVKESSNQEFESFSWLFSEFDNRFHYETFLWIMTQGTEANVIGLRFGVAFRNKKDNNHLTACLC